LPSTRALASELAVARTSVVAAYEQLLAEGYVSGKIGSGTYISSELPDATATAAGRPKKTAATDRQSIRRGRSNLLPSRPQRLLAPICRLMPDARWLMSGPHSSGAD